MFNEINFIILCSIEWSIEIIKKNDYNKTNISYFYCGEFLDIFLIADIEEYNCKVLLKKLEHCIEKA